LSPSAAVSVAGSGSRWWRSHHSRGGVVVASALPFVVVLVLWQLLGATEGPRSIFLPTPAKVAAALVELFTEQAFYSDIGWSVYRVTVAFALSVIVAVPIGILAGRFESVAILVHPINDFARYLPVPSLVPLCILWVGIGDLNKILVIFIGTVFQVIPLVSDTAASVPPSLVDLSRVHGASQRQTIMRVVVPWCSPAIYDHCRVALGWAWSYLVVAELVATTSGIGRVIIQAQRFLQTPRVMAGILVIGLIGLIFDQLMKALRPRLFPWARPN
jgi:NitT/TauT family transport system permease protein